MAAKKNRTAFSLIELSLVILIVGIIIAGVTQSTALVGKYKLYIARNQTKSSPVNAIPNLVTWLDATAEDAFINEEDQDGYGVSMWKDISPSNVAKNNATQTTLDQQPIYKDACINSLPCLNFNSTNSQSMNINLSDLAASNHTIFVVERRQSGKTASYFLAGEDTEVDNSANLVMGYKTDTVFAAGHQATAFASFSDANTAAFTQPVTRIYSYVFNPSLDYGMTMYLNGQNMNLFERNDLDIAPSIKLEAYTAPHIGGNADMGFYNGDLAEIIVFRSYVRDKDRQAIERYLGLKWGVKIIQ